MSALPWTDALRLQHEELDTTHEEFVALLNAVHAALGSEGASAAFAELLEHTEAHFAMEEAWMAELGFAAENCHSSQHRMVLELMREVGRRHAEEPALLERLVPALSEWFPQHAAMMDAALVETLREKA
jgi:hemerythrin